MLQKVTSRVPYENNGIIFQQEEKINIQHGTIRLHCSHLRYNANTITVVF